MDVPFTMAIFAAACAVTVFGAFVKGAVGFAMPMIMISGLASFMSPHAALAALIVPTLLANVWQAFRGGLAPVLVVLGEYRLYLAVVLVWIAVAAQAVTAIPQEVMLLVLGVPVMTFAAVQLAGWAPRIGRDRRWRADLSIGMAAGICGGMSGVWGPPTVLYLAAIDAPKAEAMRVQGVVYGIGAVVLLLAHINSGIVNAQTAPLSVALVPAMLLGMWAGQRVQDRLDQRRFRQAMLVVLLVAGGNLVRRGLAGM